MKIDFFYPRWESEAIDWVDFAQQVKVEDFDGIEDFPLDDPARNENMVNNPHDTGRDYIVLQAELTENGSGFNRYMDALKRNLYSLIRYQKNPIKPRYIVSQTGREYFSIEQTGPCFALGDRMAQESGIPILQETHPNKWSDAAHIVNDNLKSFPSLRLALDLSRWVCVSERFLEDQKASIDLAIQHADHLHAGVGHPQGSQVTDPRTNENKEALEHHLAWWDQWIAYLVRQGRSCAAITPEFGPYPYRAYVPDSRSPVADQHEINLWMMHLLNQRFNQFTKGNNS